MTNVVVKGPGASEMSGTQVSNKRVVRHIDLWSVVKVTFVFFLICGLIWLVAAVIFWNFLAALGWMAKFERLISSFVSGSFKLRPGSMLKVALIADALFIVALTGVSTLLALLYNLIADMVGGFAFETGTVLSVAPQGRRLIARRTVGAIKTSGQKIGARLKPDVPPPAVTNAETSVSSASASLGDQLHPSGVGAVTNETITAEIATTEFKETS